MSCCSCIPWCRTPPPNRTEGAPSTIYIESKSVVRPESSEPPSPAPAKHSRVLSSMRIKDGKAVVTQTMITDEEADRMFGRTPDKTSKAATVRFAHTTAVQSTAQTAK